MLKHATGNLLTLAEEGKFDVIVQGCNCFHTMGSGIAAEIREKYAPAYMADLTYGTKGDYDKLGNFSVMIGKEFGVSFDIVNAYTQFDFSRDRDVFEYLAFALILKKLAYWYPKKNFGFPYIGCGLAGGNETVIVSMLETFSKLITESGGSATLVKFG